MPEIIGKLMFHTEEMSSNSSFDKVTEGLLKDVASKLIPTTDTIESLAKRHEEYLWNWKSFKKYIGRGTPFEDWQYTASCFNSQLRKALRKKHHWDDIKPFYKNKYYSAIMGNWILNNHLLYYGKITNVVTKPIILYYYDPRLRGLVVNTTYNILRRGACSVSTIKAGTPIEFFPREFGDVKAPLQETTRNFLESWRRRFKFVDICELCEIHETNKFLHYVASQRSQIFTSRFPLIITASIFQYDPNNPNENFHEYVVGDLGE